MLDGRMILEESESLITANCDPKKVFWFHIDLIQLALLNRQYGRKKGDELLEATEAFINSLPQVRVCERADSSQFVFDFVLEEEMPHEEIVNLWTKLSEEFLDRQQKLYPQFNLRIACGICPMYHMDVQEIVDNATLACKESRKTKGFSPVVYTSELLDKLSSHERKEIEIEEGLKGDQFTYYLQPIVQLKDGKVVGAEALARWIKPDGTIAYPESFLPIMEENGEVLKLDYFILRSVCRDMAERRAKGRPVVCTSINLSRLHVDRTETAREIFDISQEYDIPTSLLDFELTETLPLDEFSKAKVLIDGLRGYGFQISIDDYGSGYTGITVWQDLDFDLLKMDKKFLSEDEVLKHRNNVLIPNVIDLAKKMNIVTICEGIEKPEQREALVGWDCRLGQGFLFSKPVPLEEFYRVYEENNGYFPINVQE